MALIWRGLTEEAWVRKVYRINKSNFGRVCTGFVLAIRSALYRTRFAGISEIVPQEYQGMFKEGWERTVCTDLARPFGDLTEGALLTKAACLAQSVDESCQQGPPGQGSDKPKKKTCYRRAGGESSVVG